MSNGLIGQVLGGCRITRELGRGGMATIYLAQQESPGRDVVLKILSPGLPGDETFIERFNREVATTARLQHPHIVPIYDYGQENGMPFIVMAYIPGGAVSDLIASSPLSLERTAKIIAQVADALDYAHQNGVIHRDIKSANILLDTRQNAILTDFGIAKLTADYHKITAADTLVGTFAYLAPELAVPNQTITAAADVYSLGVTVYEMLTGQLPFTGETAPQIVWSHINTPIPPASTRRPDLPPDIDSIFQKALAKSVANRYATPLELAADLTVLASGQRPAAVDAVRQTLTIPVEELLTKQNDRLEDAIARVIDQVVKINNSSGGSGSGLYLPGNLVVTCLHVINGEPGFIVELRSGEELEAETIAVSPETDLALLRLLNSPTSIEAKRLDGMLSDINLLEPGETLAAIGHPLGLDWSVTGGHFNAVRQPNEDPLPRFGINLNCPLVQVDVTINPGNSGGPIIDREGSLVGLATSIINPAVANNIGFAIHAATVWDFCNAHRDDEVALLPYDCKHFHPPDATFCPHTGRPIKAIKVVKMATGNQIAYSCGHPHDPGLEYCPLTGKPVKPLEDAGRTSTRTPTPVVALEEDIQKAVEVTCSGCRAVFMSSMAYCPTCGKPA